MKSGTPPQFPGDADPEAVVVSHGHLDHVGAIASLLSGAARPSIHWTPPTRELSLTLARDTLKLHGGSYNCPFTETDLRRVTQVPKTHEYRETFEGLEGEIRSKAAWKRRIDVGMLDVVDALALAATARLGAEHGSEVLGGQTDGEGLPMEIVYPSYE